MSSRKAATICTAILAGVVSLQCTAGKQAGVESRQNSASEPDHYAQAIGQARGSARSDGLSRLFKIEGKVSLEGGQVKDIDRLTPASDGTILVVDSGIPRVESYDHDGRFVRAIGERGNKPGGYVFPTDSAETEGQAIAIPDFQSHRVNVHSPEGTFIKSFVYGIQGFSAQRIIYDDTTKSFYLFGNRWKYGDGRRVTGADIVHKYSTDGTFQESYLPFPDDFKALDLYVYNEPAVDIKDGHLFVVLPFDYTIYRLSPDGVLSKFITGDDPAFKKPSRGMKIEKGTDVPSVVRNWRLSWTPIDNLVVAGDHLLVQYQTFDPLRYTIDIWSIATKRKVESVKTNHAVLASGKDGDIYFLDNLEAKGQPKYEVLRARLELP